MRLLALLLVPLALLASPPVPPLESLTVVGHIRKKPARMKPLPLLEGPVDELIKAASPAVEPVTIPPFGVDITCSPAPKAMNKNLPKGIIRWSCIIHNLDPEPREVTEPMVLHALISSGVMGATSSAISEYAMEDQRLSGWRRLAIYTTKLVDPAVTAIAIGVLKVPVDEATIFAGAKLILPFMAERFLERAQTLPVPVWHEAAVVMPGGFITRTAFSQEWDGPSPVRALIP